MASIRTVIHDRRIEIPAPDDLPDGTEVEIDLVPVGEKVGCGETEWDDTPEGIADWLAWYDSLEPLILTVEEQEELQSDRQARKAWEKVQFENHADKLAKDWE